MGHLYTARTDCRGCHGPLEPLLNMGAPVLSDFVAPDAPDPARVPLDVVICQRCELVQLRYTTDPEKLYRTYWYRSGINEAMREELADIAHAIQRQHSHGTILDIGANDGTLLLNFDGADWNRIGVDPCRTIQPLVSASRWITDFFPAATADMPAHSCEAITSIACFYDLDDPKSFIAEVDRLLTPDGVWICQFQDLKHIVERNAFDNFGAEHLCYYSVKTFQSLLTNFDLVLTDVETRAINAGSVRLTIQRPPVHRSVSVAMYRTSEDAVLSHDALDHFAWRVGQYRDQLVGIIDHTLSQDLPVDLYAASTKSSTLLQYCWIDHKRIRQAVERTPEKVGLVTSGTRIPVVSEATWRTNPAPVTLLGAWQFTDQFIEREREYLQQGGTFLVPLPAPRLIYGRY